MTSIRLSRSIAITVMALVSLALSMVLAGCGEAAVEEKIEQEMEQAMGGGDADVDVDINDDDSGSISISGGDGDANISFGDSASIPEGFPKELLPGDADIESAMNVSEGDGAMQTVAFRSGKNLNEMYSWFLDALPNAGYQVENKMQFDSDGNKGFTIMGSGSGDNCTVTGADDGEGFIYSVMIVSD